MISTMAKSSERIIILLTTTITLIVCFPMIWLGKVRSNIKIEEHFYGAYKPGRNDKMGFKPY